MDESKRSFLKIAGTTTLGSFGLGWSSRGALARGQEIRTIQTESLPQALEGTNWAMVVDMKKCLEQGDCSDCSDECHRIHNVPTIDDPAEEVKWIWKESYEHVFPTQVHPFTEEALKEKPVLVFCIHSERPPCARVCPTQATWKRDDGLVMMDQHRCIGCRYCLAACPYGSRSFNWSDPRPNIKPEIRPDYPTRTKGVVEKCNFCAERLAKGLQPACVEVCRAKALVFGDLGVRNSEVAGLLRERFSIRRKPSLGTGPKIFYIV